MAQDEKSRSHKLKMETLMETYERINQEKEEKELEMRYRVQMLENTMPGLMMWNIWRMMMSMQGTQMTPTSSKFAISESTKELTNELKSLTDKLNTQNKILQEMKSSEEESKNKLREYEGLLAKEQILYQVLNQENDQDVELFEKLSKMAKERAEMDQKIKDLELKEKLYKETIEHADNFISKMENKMSTQEINERDSISSGNLEEKVVAMDTELKRIRDELSSKEEEKQLLRDTERKLLQRLQETMNDIENMRKEIEGPLKAKIQMSKQKTKALEEEIKSSKEYPKKIEILEVDEELKAKEEMTEKELREELQQRLAESREMIDQEILSAKGEFRFTTVGEMQSNSDEDSVILSHIVSEHDLESAQNKENLKESCNKWKTLMPVGLSNVPATQFQAFIAMIERDEENEKQSEDESIDKHISTEKLSKRCIQCSSLVLKSLEKFLEDVKELKEYIRKGDTLMTDSTCSFLMQ